MGSFKPRHIGMALNAHAAMGRAPSPALLSSIQARSLVLAPLLDERGVSNTMWAFAKFGTAPNDELLAALENRCMELITSYGPQSLANTIWGYAVLGVVPGGMLLQAWSDQARLKAAEMNPQNLANIMWAMGSLRLNPLSGDLVAEVERRSCEAMGDFTPQAISNVVWGFASCGVRPGDALIESLGGRAVQCVSNFSAQAISNTLWGFATLGIHPDEQVMGALSSQAEVQVATFTPQNIANTMWAMACLRWTPSQRFQRCIEEQVEARIREFNAQDVANLAWGFATLGIAPSRGTLLRSLETQGCSRAREFTAQVPAHARACAIFFVFSDLRGARLHDDIVDSGDFFFTFFFNVVLAGHLEHDVGLCNDGCSTWCRLGGAGRPKGGGNYGAIQPPGVVKFRVGVRGAVHTAKLRVATGRRSSLRGYFALFPGPGQSPSMCGFEMMTVVCLDGRRVARFD